MNELFDKLILRFVLALVVLLALYLYKHAHRLLYPSTKSQVLNRFIPSKNSADTIHLFGRILGVGLIFSEFYFHLDSGFMFSLMDFFLRAFLSFIAYLVSLYVIEGIVLYNFEYSDEVIKRKNIPYSLICFSHAIGTAFILKTILKVTTDSMIMFIFLWLLALVLIGFASKTFSFMSKLSFNRLLIQRNMSIGISYMGFFLGWSLIIGSSLNNQLSDLKWYTIQVILKILLSIIILPLFIKGIKSLFKLKDDVALSNKSDQSQQGHDEIELGHGVYEGACFLTCCFLTIVITGRIYFGTFYPIF